MKILGRCHMMTMSVLPRSFVHGFVSGVDLFRKICRVFKATRPRWTNILVLSDTTFLQIFNVVLPFYAMPPAPVEYWGVDEDEPLETGTWEGICPENADQSSYSLTSHRLSHLTTADMFLISFLARGCLIFLSLLFPPSGAGDHTQVPHMPSR